MRVPGDQVPRISQEQAHEHFQHGSAIFVDLRSSGHYRESHLAGARSIPLKERARELFDLPHDRRIITY